MDTETYQTSLSEFRTHLWDEIQLNVATNLSVDREEFLEYVAEQLTEAEEIDDFLMFHMKDLADGIAEFRLMDIHIQSLMNV